MSTTCLAHHITFSTHTHKLCARQWWTWVLLSRDSLQGAQVDHLSRISRKPPALSWRKNVLFSVHGSGGHGPDYYVVMGPRPAHPCTGIESNCCGIVSLYMFISLVMPQQDSIPIEKRTVVTRYPDTYVLVKLRLRQHI